MTTQPTQGVAIEPIVYPLNAGTATQMSVLVLNFTTEATTCTTYWQLLTEDGLRIEFGDDWVHLRGSNTEPIIRIYAESTTPDAARDLAQRLMADIQGLV